MSNLKKFKRDLSWSKDYGKMIKMISDESYIRWIEDFTNTHSEFSSDDWDYKPDEISPEDYEANIMNATFGEAIWATGGLEKFFAGLISVGEMVIARKVGKARR